MSFRCSLQVAVTGGAWEVGLHKAKGRLNLSMQLFTLDSSIVLLASFELIAHGVHGHCGQGAAATASRTEAVLTLI